jgi:hypothetical protein
MAQPLLGCGESPPLRRLISRRAASLSSSSARYAAAVVRGEAAGPAGGGGGGGLRTKKPTGPSGAPSVLDAAAVPAWSARRTSSDIRVE